MNYVVDAHSYTKWHHMSIPVRGSVKMYQTWRFKNDVATNRRLWVFFQSAVCFCGLCFYLIFHAVTEPFDDHGFCMMQKPIEQG